MVYKLKPVNILLFYKVEFLFQFDVLEPVSSSYILNITFAEFFNFDILNISTQSSHIGLLLGYHFENCVTDYLMLFDIKLAKTQL